MYNNYIFSCSGLSSFNEFERRAAEKIVNDETIKNRFVALSRKGDLTGMINLTLEALKINEKSTTPEIDIKESFRGKSADWSERFLNQDREEPNLDLLNEAVNFAPARSRIFYAALSERARAWYLIGNYKRCLNDCRFFTETIVNDDKSSKSDNDEDEIGDGVAVNARIDMLLLQSDCCKILRDPIEARSLLNEVCDCTFF